MAKAPARVRTDPDALLESCIPAVRNTAQALRAMLRECLPEAQEWGYSSSQTLSWRDPAAGKRSRQFVHVELYPDKVRLGFDDGAMLEDPAGLLQGDAKRARWVQLDDTAAVRRLHTPLSTLVAQAIQLGRNKS